MVLFEENWADLKSELNLVDIIDSDRDEQKVDLITSTVDLSRGSQHNTFISF